MKVIKILRLILLLIVIGVGSIILIYKHEHDIAFRDDVAYCVIYLDEDIDSLNTIEFQICDSIYHYSINDLKDTVNENLGISDKEFPCSVRMIYNFNSGKKKIIVTDSFNSGGYSGANIYMLRKDTVRYRYSS